MSFIYVDRIYSISAGREIRGLKNITASESFFYRLPDGQRVISPAVITEAIAQLGSWLESYNTDFTKRPVLLCDELTTYLRPVYAGEQLDLFVSVIDSDDDVVASWGEARVGGELVAVSKHCRGYLMPIEEFQNRDDVIRQFQQIYKPDVKRDPPAGPSVIPIHDHMVAQSDRLKFVDGVTTLDQGRQVAGFKNFAASETYFATHFPRKPVVPGVLLMTFIGELCQFLVFDPAAGGANKVLMPQFIRNIRFRKFVEPGDQAFLHVDVISGDCSKANEPIEVKATMTANGQRVMTAEMGFITKFGARL